MQPTSPSRGISDKEAVIQQARQRAPEPIINFIRSIFSPYFPYNDRLIPIVTANIHGPAISPIDLERPSADSANADAHCAIESSDAPAHTISRMESQNSGTLSRLPILIPLPSSVGCSIGHTAKLNTLHSGITAQMQESHLQFSIPNNAKNRVERSITPTAPQQ